MNTDAPRENSRSLTAREIRRLPLEERDKILEQAAEAMREYYEATAEERVEWQGGDIIEYEIPD